MRRLRHAEILAADRFGGDGSDIEDATLFGRNEFQDFTECSGQDIWRILASSKEAEIAGFEGA